MRRALFLLVLLALGGCGSSPPREAEPVLSTDALPGLEATTEPVTAEDLAADFGTGVSVDGFVSGTERVFQGESHDLARVVSRTLEFESPEAAAAYVELVHTHVDDLYGVGRRRSHSRRAAGPVTSSTRRPAPATARRRL